jgi:hypothetical protein
MVKFQGVPRRVAKDRLMADAAVDQIADELDAMRF